MKSAIVLLTLLTSSLTFAQNSGGPCKFITYADKGCKGKSDTHKFGLSNDCFGTSGKKSFKVEGCDLAMVQPAQNKYCDPKQGKAYAATKGKCIDVDLNQLTGHKWGGAQVNEVNGPSH